MALKPSQIKEFANALIEAETHYAPIPPLTASVPDMSAADAYAVQMEVLKHRLHLGHRIVGRKVGLTSKAMQQMLNVDQPDYGAILEDMLIKDGASYEVKSLLQPRIEAEVAFMMKKPLKGPNVTIEQVMDATDFVFPALEVIDSRIKDWKIKLADTIADNASSARVVVGNAKAHPRGMQLDKVELVFEKNGKEIARATGEAVLGNPANAVAWCANKLAEFGTSINAGDLVMPGALAAATPVAGGDTIKATFSGIGSVSVKFV
ncbi:MAG: 2-keto-4-pentenoate hydratase [SAR202 cluster bacterium]|nr:2-keto-4-pentenoate hydratase [SAR202 cluster bacterium]